MDIDINKLYDLWKFTIYASVTSWIIIKCLSKNCRLIENEFGPVFHNKQIKRKKKKH